MELTGDVEFGIDSGLALITLNRPAANNAIDLPTLSTLIESFQYAFSSGDVRVVLLRGRGETFCSGMDLSALIESGVNDDGALRAAIRDFSGLLSLITNGPKAVVAAVTGNLFAGGVGLAGACDIVYAVDSVHAQLGEIVFGLVPANIMAPLVDRRISVGTFRRWALTAERIQAEEAVDAGLLDRAFDCRNALEKGLRSLIKQLFRASPKGVDRLKSLIAVRSQGADGSYARETLFDLATDRASLEAIRAMQEGGLPEWFARCRPETPLIPEE